MIFEELVFPLRQAKPEQSRPINQEGPIFNYDVWCLEESHHMNNDEVLVGSRTALMMSMKKGRVMVRL